MCSTSNKINIALSCDENYSKYAGIVIASILANAKNTDILDIYILDGGISEKSKEKILSLKNIKNCNIEFVNIDDSLFEDYKNIQTHHYISIAACYRLKLATLLPNVDKIIYLDCDVTVCSSLKELFNINLGNSVIAGVRDIDLGIKNYQPQYINSGVLLIDLNKIRTQNIENELLEYTKKNINNIKMGDQEIINNVLNNKILNIDEKYNVQSECYIRRSSFTKNPVIIHFIGDKKPWHFGSWSVHKDLYFKYLQMTPWKLSQKELFKWGIPNQLTSFLTWFKHRPIFYLQKKFWNAVKMDINTKDTPKVFVVILMACFGDIILCNSLFQNIKRLYPNSKTIFIIDKPWIDVAKYQKDVDEVFVLDKRGENKGFWGLVKFVRKFPYKKIDCIFKIYDNFRADIISIMLKPKKIIGKPYDYNISVQERHCKLLKRLTKDELVNYPITYNANNDIPKKLQNVLSKDKKYVALCTTSKLKEKDMPLQTTVELINKLNKDNYTVLFIGNGKNPQEYAELLYKNQCNFTNLVNQTSIYELAQVLRNCEALISVDTGTMHFSYANKVPTVCVFYKQNNIKHWAPRKTLYPYTILPQTNSVEDIYTAFKELMQNNNFIRKDS